MTAAVGNDWDDDNVWWPAIYDSVVAVGAVDTLSGSGSLAHDGELHANSGYSNYDKDSLILDLVAPVDNGIVANAYDDDECLCPCELDELTRKTGFGTSHAAPQVAGVAALVRSRYPSLSATEVIARLKKGAEYYWDSDTLGPYKYGAGKINAYRSITEWDTVSVNTTWDADCFPSS